MPDLPLDMLRPRRAIDGWSAVLLPYRSSGEIDWDGFTGLVQRTLEAGLVPAVNMDTGYTNLLDEQTRREVLARTAEITEGARFAAGAFVADGPGSQYSEDSHLQALSTVAGSGGIPVAFQSHGLTALDEPALVAAYQRFGDEVDGFVAFELGQVFASFGSIYSTEVFRELLSIPSCIGAKHSSLRRSLEWERLALRDELRRDFRVFTGNDLAIDMVMYGSDYLLGLSALAPDAFAVRDEAWARGDAGFFELNDALQALGAFAFRPPVPAYKHTVAQVLWLRGWLEEPSPHPEAPGRPDSDIEVLKGLLARLEALL